MLEQLFVEFADLFLVDEGAIGAAVLEHDDRGLGV